MSNAGIGFSIILSSAACCIFYLSCAQQGWRERTLPVVPARLGSAILVIASLWLLTRQLSLSAALFTELASVFLLLGLIPFVSLWQPPQRVTNTRNGEKSASPHSPTDRPVATHWWSKSIAGVVLGLTLAVALAGLIARYGPGGIDAPNKVQFIMWIIAPLWMLCIGLVFFFRSGLRAWLTLLAVNVLAYALLFARTL